MANPELESKLAEVLAAEVVGYSRLMQGDAHATVADLDECRAVFRARMAEARGRVVDVNRSLQTEINRVFSLWQQCREAHHQEGPWLFGRFTIADAMYAPVALRFPTYGVTLPPVAADYVATVEDDPDVQQWIAAALAETAVIDADEAGGDASS